MIRIKTTLLILWVLLICNACGIYSFSGTSIAPDVESISIEYFENKALQVNPSLANTLTEELIDKYRKLTKLDILTEEGDLNVYGEIMSYEVNPTAVTADEVASKNRLTITVQITFTNKKHPEEDFEKSFAGFADYDSMQSLDAVQDALVLQITEVIVEDIFNATVANW